MEKPDPTKPLCDLSKLKPFASDPAKQRRYEEFERSIRQRNKGKNQISLCKRAI